MTDFKLLAECKQSEKAEKLQSLREELQSLKDQIREAEAKQEEAVTAGDQKAYTQTGHNMDYLKRRKAEIERRIDALENEPLEDHESVIKHRAELSEIQRAAEREKLITFINDWDTLKAHLKETAAAFNAANAAGQLYSRYVLQDENENLTYIGQNLSLFIQEIEQSLRYVPIRDAAAYYKEHYPERFN